MVDGEGRKKLFVERRTIMSLTSCSALLLNTLLRREIPC